MTMRFILIHKHEPHLLESEENYNVSCLRPEFMSQRSNIEQVGSVKELSFTQNTGSGYSFVCMYCDSPHRLDQIESAISKWVFYCSYHKLYLMKHLWLKHHVTTVLHIDLL